MFVDHARFLPRKIQIKFFSQILQQIPVDNFSNFFCDSFFMVVITLPSPHYNCLKNLFFLNFCLVVSHIPWCLPNNQILFYVRNFCHFRLIRWKFSGFLSQPFPRQFFKISICVLVSGSLRI